jgi:hypothetical protein
MRMRRVLLALTCAAALCAPSATTARQAAGVPVATSCTGSVIVKVKGTSVRASSIRTTKVSCTAGKALIDRLLTKVGSSPACRTAADRPPPTTGCIVTGYHCFRKRSPDYCSTITGRFVQWRESHLLSGKPPRSAQ